MMRSSTCSVLLLAIFSTTTNLLADTFGTGDDQFEIEFATIGNPGNAADDTGFPNPAGSVPYVYRIGKHEVSRIMIDQANATAGLGIPLAPMDFLTGDIRPDMPATGVSWNEAARFVNWLNTSKGFTPAYKFATQPGDAGYDANEDILLWEPADVGYNPNNLFRNSRAHYFLPSIDEWYKAAFYDPGANDGSGGYWDYTNGSDSVPSPVASGSAAGTAVWDQPFEQGPADISLAGGLSPYGVMGMGGNVWEYEETEFDLVNDDPRGMRGVRGGAWSTDNTFYLGVFDQEDGGTRANNQNLGFRVASIPEPSSAALLAWVLLSLGLRKRRMHAA